MGRKRGKETTLLKNKQNNLIQDIVENEQNNDKFH
jgi:hypothetical protein